MLQAAALDRGRVSIVQPLLVSTVIWALPLGVVGFLFQQLSLATGALVPSVATVSVANPVVSVMLGALVLQERLDRTPEWHAVIAVGALGMALFGAVVIASAREVEQETAREPSASAASVA